MTQPDQSAGGNLFRQAARDLRIRFSLNEDRADSAVIDEELRAAVQMRGAKLWVLMFAIFIASIGLNVNSTAAIIGAMLISPLMGPIMGIGYGAGTYDFALVRTSLSNLGIAALIALLVSAAYFALSPLTTAQSELLARTSPTIWDVLIALFGGLAGIIGATRKEKSTVIPGVAIATALIPPLCTAGFGIARGDWHFFVGAMYLFTINCVFIASSSAVVAIALNLPRKAFVDERSARRVHLYLAAVVVLTVLPSLYLAYELVGEEIFRARATQFVHSNLEFKLSHVVAVNIDPLDKRIEVTLIGNVVPKSTLAEVASRLPAAKLAGVKLRIFQAGEQGVDIAALRTNLLGDLYKDSQAELEKKDHTIGQLQVELDSLKGNQDRFNGVPLELRALYPQITNVMLAEAPDWDARSGWNTETTVILNVRTSKPLRKPDRARLEEWLRNRLKTDQVRLIVEASAT